MATVVGLQWTVDRIVQFSPGEFVKRGLVHFGFHTRDGRMYCIGHKQHWIGLVDDSRIAWTVSPSPVFPGVPNIAAELNFPRYVDVLLDGSLVISNFGNARLYRVDPKAMVATLLIDGRTLGMTDMGNCVVDGEGSIWVNEVTGCRIWKFDTTGKPVETLGSGTAGFSSDDVSFRDARFNWIYDMRRGRDSTIDVLDSRNFAVREIDIDARIVRTVAGSGKSGYTGDGGDARNATFGSYPGMQFDGPSSLSVDDAGNVYVGDRFNNAVRMIEHESGIISTIAGGPNYLCINLPNIVSMDYDDGLLFVPIGVRDGWRELIVLRRARSVRRLPSYRSTRHPSSFATWHRTRRPITTRRSSRAPSAFTANQ